MMKITSNLRQRDRDELFATNYGEDPELLARHAVAGGAFRWAAYLDGEPVAAIGAFPRWPGVWTVWAYGTDDWPSVVVSVTRHVRRFMLPAIVNSGAHRADALALAEHSDARRWLISLGAKEEHTLDGWGKKGQTFVSYVWTRKTAKALIAKTRRK